MPVYSYRCEEGHIGDEIRPFSEINDPYECSECGKNGVHILNRRPVKEVADIGMNQNVSGPSSYVVFEDRKCLDCEVIFDYHYDTREAKAEASCPSCQSTRTKKVQSLHSIDRFSERFPYYDRGLGLVLQSKQHRRKICKERGLVPVDGDFNIKDMDAEERARINEEQRTIHRLQDNMKHNPAYAEYRRHKANGWNPNFKHRRQR